MAATGTKVVRSHFGRIPADGGGQALYRFSRETGGASSCYGACAEAWPPVYSYLGDSPGHVLCHDVTEFGGVWRVIRSDGSPVR